jgi:hypothetical protein
LPPKITEVIEHTYAQLAADAKPCATMRTVTAKKAAEIRDPYDLNLNYRS